MNEPLEDHAGDILRKARMSAGMELAEAAALAGLTEHDYRFWESQGPDPSATNLERLATGLGLSASKFLRIVQGWKPQPIDLREWREIRAFTTEKDGLSVHSYLVWDEVTRDAALFDTGWDTGAILAWIKEQELQPRHLFLTHTHEDHMAAMGELRTAFPKIRLHTNAKSAPPQHRNLPQDFIHLGNLRISNRSTPGHAEDGVVYLIGNWPEDAPHVAMVGDTIFAGSLATGFDSWTILKKSVQDQILTLPDSTLLCPGHGPLTTVGEEKRANPFFS